jgi:hypothetical protein
MFTAKITTRTVGNLHFDKQTRYALASALTLTGKEIQTETVKKIEGTFNIRNSWDKPSNILGVRVKPATKQNLVVWIGTAADFLEKFVREHEGSIVLKIPQGRFVAIPTSNVRRTKRDIIRAAQRPARLRGKRDIVLPLRSGKGMVLFQARPSSQRGERRSPGGMRGKSGRLVALYILVPQAKIKEKDVLFGPAKRTFEKRFAGNYERQLRQAFASAR